MNVPREAVGEDLVLAGFKLPDVSSSPRNPALSGSLSVTRSSGALQRCLLIVFASCFLEPLICFVFTSLSLIWFTCSFFLRLSSAICSLALIIVKYTSFQGEGRGGGPEYPKLQTFADGTDLTPVEAKFISLFFFICNWRSFFERTKNFFVRDFSPSTLRTQTSPASCVGCHAFPQITKASSSSCGKQTSLPVSEKVEVDVELDTEPSEDSMSIISTLVETFGVLAVCFSLISFLFLCVSTKLFSSSSLRFVSEVKTELQIPMAATCWNFAVKKLFCLLVLIVTLHFFSVWSRACKPFH